MYGYGYRYSSKPGLLAFDPLGINGLQLYLNKKNATASSWLDQSSNAFDFTQATGTKQPTISANSVDFDGVDDSLDNSTANVFSGDSSGIIFFSGYFDNTNTNVVLSSSDTATNNYFVSIGLLTTGEIYVQVKDGTTTDTIKSTATITNGAYYYGYIKSNGTAYEFNVDGSISTPVVVGGTNRGHFFADIINRDNLILGKLIRTTVGGGAVNENKIIYSNDHTIDTTPILNFLSNPDN